MQFTLQPGETFLAQSAGDLTGVLVQTDNPVAVFTGNVRSFNDYQKKSRDHLVEQVSLIWSIAIKGHNDNIPRMQFFIRIPSQNL